MGLTNRVVQRAMEKRADRIAKWASETYPVVKGQNQGLTEQEIHLRMLPGGDRPEELSEQTRHVMDECSKSIEGICYMVAEIAGVTKDLMNFRVLQLTTLIDRALYARGFKRQSTATKERILAALDLPLEDWQTVAGEP